MGGRAAAGDGGGIGRPVPGNGSPRGRHRARARGAGQGDAPARGSSCSLRRRSRASSLSARRRFPCPVRRRGLGGRVSEVGRGRFTPITPGGGNAVSGIDPRRVRGCRAPPRRRDSWFPRASPSEYSLARLDRGSRARLAPRRVRAPRGVSPPRRFVPPTSPGKRQIRVGGPHNLSRRRDRLARETRLAPRRRSSPGCRAHARALLGAHSARHLGARHASRSARPRRALVPPALPPRVSARPAPASDEARRSPRKSLRGASRWRTMRRISTPCSAWTPGRRRRRYARRIARRRCAGTQTRIPTIRGGRR